MAEDVVEAAAATGVAAHGVVVTDHAWGPAGLYCASPDEAGYEAFVDSEVGAPACAGTDTDAFFSRKPDVMAWCLRICAGCEVWLDCLAGALAHDEQWGIWGGVVFRPWVESCTVRWYRGAWHVWGITPAVGKVYCGRFDTEEEARAGSEQVLAEGRRRKEAGAALRTAHRTTGSPNQAVELRRSTAAGYATGNAATGEAA